MKSIDGLIQEFSAGKVPLTYYLIEPKYTRRQRRMLSSCLALVVVLIFCLILFFGPRHYNSVVDMLGLFALVLGANFIMDLIWKRLITSYSIVGTLTFHLRYFELDRFDEDKMKLEYNSILRIRHRRGMRSTITARFGGAKSTIVRMDCEGQTISTEVAEKMVTPSSEVKHFTSIGPSFSSVLESLHPRYGTKEFSK